MNRIVLLILILSCSVSLTPALAQTTQQIIPANLYADVLKPYFGFYHNFAHDKGLNPQRNEAFTRAFEPNARIANDLPNNRLQSKLSVEGYIAQARVSFLANNGEGLSSPAFEGAEKIQELIYESDGAYDYVTLHRIFTYLKKGLAQRVDTGVKLVIHKTYGGFKITAVILCPYPYDIMPDDREKTETKKIDTVEKVLVLTDTVYINGVERIRTVYQTVQEEAPIMRGPRHGLILDATAGWLFTIPNKTYSNNFSAGKNNWQYNAGLRKSGLVVDLSLTYHFLSWLSIGGGVMVEKSPQDEGYISTATRSFLQNDQSTYHNVQVKTFEALRCHWYGQLGFSAYNFLHGSFRAAPTLMYTQAVQPNDVNITIGDATNSYTNLVPFAEEPSFLYGGFLSYDCWIVPARLGFTVKCFYFNGTQKVADQNITLAGNTSTVHFSDQHLQMAGATAGVHWRLTSAKQQPKD